MLMLPNIIWTKNQPKDYEKYVSGENKVLLGFERTGEKMFTYYDDDGKILKSYCYTGDKEKFLNRNNAKCKKMER